MSKLTDKLNTAIPKKESSDKEKSPSKKFEIKRSKKDAKSPETEEKKVQEVKAEEVKSESMNTAAAKPAALKSAPKAPMSEKAKKNMVVKFIFGIVVLIVFVIFAYISISVAPHTSDIPDDYYSPNNYHRGVERVKSTETPVATEVPQEAVEAVEATPAEVSAAPEVTATPELRPEEIKAQELGLPSPPEIDIDSWEYLLVNASNPISEDYRPESFAALNLTMSETDIQTTTDDYSSTRCLVDSRIGEALRDFALGCKEAGLPVYLSSGYRSYSEQSSLFQRKVSQGYSEDVAKTIVAYPGTSEHQTGLCCDITDRYRETKDSSLAETDTYKWLCENCADYGFVVRYPVDKSGSADSITGIIYEPWHFRYVGVEVAKYMTENNLCLEEFVALYE